MSALPAPILSTSLHFDGWFERYQGKVRDVYNIEEAFLALVATDRVSAFDVVFEAGIPYKGQVLNQLAAFFLEDAKDICPNHFITSPDPNVSLGAKCEPYPVEVIVRGHLCGHAWREYASGKREVSGVALPDGLCENDPLPEPIITPTTKSQIGHDIDITEQELTKSGLVPADEWMEMRHYALQLFARGQAHARSKGLILADTKYEFGNKELHIVLIDEIHTPDSSRYFYADGFEDRQQAGEAQPQLSKEHLRKWLLEQGFSGQAGQTPPALSAEIVQELSRRYIEVYERLTGLAFVPRDYTGWERAMQSATQRAV